jgi:hypothetical protein
MVVVSPKLSLLIKKEQRERTPQVQARRAKSKVGHNGAKGTKNYVLESPIKLIVYQMTWCFLELSITTSNL